VAPTAEELAPARPWAARVDAMARFSAAMAAAEDVDDHGARAALVAALAVVVKTKAVMADAGLRVAKALVKHQPPDSEVCDYLVTVLTGAPHAKARLCAAECVGVLAEMPGDVFANVLCRAVEVAVQDKSEDVRAAGRAALASFGNMHGQPVVDKLVAEMSEAAQARVHLANSSRNPDGASLVKACTIGVSRNICKMDSMPATVKTDLPVALESEAATASTTTPIATAAASPDVSNPAAQAPLQPSATAKPASLRDVIRNKRLAMKQQQENPQT
jgi:hypothetical protein